MVLLNPFGGYLHEIESDELDAASFVKFILKFNPVQTKSVQKTLQTIHAQ